MSEKMPKSPAGTGAGFWYAMQRDLYRHFVYHPNASIAKKVSVCVLVEGIWATSVYRLGRVLRCLGGPAKVAWPIYRAAELAVRLLTGIHLDVDADIGPGFYVGHHGAIYVGPGVSIGADSSIGQMCHLGRSKISSAAPCVGSRVYLGPGCKILGPVRIGDGAAVGTNAVVLEDVLAGTTVVGIPARVVSKQGSEDLIYLGEGSPLNTGIAVADGHGWDTRRSVG
jgi:serine O-acetyltransferase